MSTPLLHAPWPTWVCHTRHFSSSCSVCTLPLAADFQRQMVRGRKPPCGKYQQTSTSPNLPSLKFQAPTSRSSGLCRLCRDQHSGTHNDLIVTVPGAREPPLPLSLYIISHNCCVLELGEFTSPHLKLLQSPMKLSQLLVVGNGLPLQCLCRLSHRRYTTTAQCLRGHSAEAHNGTSSAGDVFTTS